MSFNNKRWNTNFTSINWITNVTFVVWSFRKRNRFFRAMFTFDIKQNKTSTRSHSRRWTKKTSIWSVDTWRTSVNNWNSIKAKMIRRQILIITFRMISCRCANRKSWRIWMTSISCWSWLGKTINLSTGWTNAMVFFSRLETLSYGEHALSQAHWNQAKTLEFTRRQRMNL